MLTFWPKNLEKSKIILIFAPNNLLMLMKKSLLIFSIILSLIFAWPSMMTAIPVAPGIEEFVDEEITITVKGQTVMVNGAQGQTLEVISLTGRCIMTEKIESPAQKIELNIPKGCYILKIGKVVRKVSVR
jgi:hypothetical protein